MARPSLLAALFGRARSSAPVSVAEVIREHIGMTEADRIKALERALTQLAEVTASTATATAAQGVVCRAVVELIGRSPTLTVSDIADLALLMAADMPAEIGTAVGAMLAEAPAPSQVRH